MHRAHPTTKLVKPAGFEPSSSNTCLSLLHRSTTHMKVHSLDKRRGVFLRGDAARLSTLFGRALAGAGPRSKLPPEERAIPNAVHGP